MEFLQGILPRKYQEQISETCKNKNCLVILPTGLGKTLIALMLAIERMKQFPGEKVVFLAPTRPLAEQHLNSFKKHLPELFGQMELFTGKVIASKRKEIWKTADIIFSTPQCVANDLKKGLYDLQEACLLVEDEAHKCLKNYDYNYIAREYLKQAQNPRIIGLTASPGSNKERIKQICKNLSVEEVELRTRDSDDVKEYLQELNIEKIKVDFPPRFQEIRQILKELFNKKTTELQNRKLLFGMVSGTTLIQLQQRLIKTISAGNKNFNNLKGISTCSQAIKLNHAIGLLETQTLDSFYNYLEKLFDEGRKAKSKASIQLANSRELTKVYFITKTLLETRAEHPKLEKLIEIIKKEISKNPKMKSIVFSQYRDSVKLISKRLNEIPEINAKVFVGQLKKQGMGMDQKQQQKIIQEFSEGKINVLCATCIAEEGLDIPEVNNVIFYEPIPSEIRKIQRAGRTARLMKGKLILLITKNTRDEIYHYISTRREKKMHSIIGTIKQELKNKEKQKTL